MACRKKIRIFKSGGIWYADVPMARKYHVLQQAWTFEDAVAFAVGHLGQVAGHSCD